MTNNWPDKPGYPPEPGKSGWHFLAWKTDPEGWFVSFWTAELESWDDIYSKNAPEIDYLGPCLPGPNWQAGRDQVIKFISNDTYSPVNSDYQDAHNQDRQQLVKAIQSLPPPEGCAPSQDLAAFEALAQWSPSSQDLQLHLGEMTSQEMRTIKAFWIWKRSELRAAIARVRGGV